MQYLSCSVWIINAAPPLPRPQTVSALCSSNVVWATQVILNFVVDIVLKQVKLFPVIFSQV